MIFFFPVKQRKRKRELESEWRRQVLQQTQVKKRCILTDQFLLWLWHPNYNTPFIRSLGQTVDVDDWLFFFGKQRGKGKQNWNPNGGGKCCKRRPKEVFGVCWWLSAERSIRTHHVSNWTNETWWWDLWWYSIKNETPWTDFCNKSDNDCDCITPRKKFWQRVIELTTS